MKKSLLTFLGSLLFFAAQAQLSLQLNNPPVTVYGGYTDALISSTFSVTNTGTQPINLHVGRYALSEVPGSENNFCWGVNCYPPNVSISPDFETIAPGATNSSFIGDYTPNNNPGVTSIKYCFFQMSNPLDTVCTTINFDATAAVLGTKEELAQQTLSTASPNPANSLALISYTLPANAKNGKLVLHNAVGALVKTIELNKNTSNLILTTNELPNGIYFYTLVADTEIVATRKLVVKH
jgi:hypothetical protein